MSIAKRVYILLIGIVAFVDSVWGAKPQSPNDDLRIDHIDAERLSIEDYRRELSLSEGVARTSYRGDGRHYEREYFCSMADAIAEHAYRCSYHNYGISYHCAFWTFFGSFYNNISCDISSIYRYFFATYPFANRPNRSLFFTFKYRYWSTKPSTRTK